MPTPSPWRPVETGLHAELGEVLVLAADGTVTPAAEAEFAKAPDDPRSRYYAAEAALQRWRPRRRRARNCEALLADAPADAPWRQTVADRLAELAPAGPPAAADPLSRLPVRARRTSPPPDRCRRNSGRR